MATVWIAVGYGVYSKEAVAEILAEFMEEVAARGLKREFVRGVAAGRIHIDGGTIQVDDTDPTVDVFLDVLKRRGIVPAIT